METPPLPANLMFGPQVDNQNLADRTRLAALEARHAFAITSDAQVTLTSMGTLYKLAGSTSGGALDAFPTTATVDTDGMWSSDGKVTIKTAGLWHFIGSVGFASTADTGYCYVQLRKDGTEIAAHNGWTQASYSTTFSCSIILDLAVNAYIELWAAQNRAASGQTSTNYWKTFIHAARLSA